MASLSASPPGSPGPPAPPAPRAPAAFYTAATLNRDTSVGWLLKQGGASFGRVLDQRMSALGVTSAQWPSLLLIDRLPEATSSGLARTLSMNPGAMTRMLDRLIEKGLVERQPCPRDRRAARLLLTDSGREAVGPIADVLATCLNDAVRGFSAEEFATLISLLQRLNANVQALSPPGPGLAVPGTPDAEPAA